MVVLYGAGFHLGKVGFTSDVWISWSIVIRAGLYMLSSRFEGNGNGQNENREFEVS